MLRGKKLLGLICLWPFVAGAAQGGDPDRIFTQAEVASIDRENKMLRLVNGAETVEANIQRLLAAGFPAAEVAALKPRLADLWRIDPWLQFGWLDQETVARIVALEPKYAVRMRKARLRQELYRLGGEHEPFSPEQIKAKWYGEILQLLDYRETQEFFLMNSPAARHLYRLTKDVPLTVAERRELCGLQQEYYRIKNLPSQNPGEIAERAEAMLSHWQIKRDLLGDERFVVYLQAADPGFRQMAGVLKQIGGVNNSEALDLWWIREKYEIVRGRAANGREAQKMEAEVSAKVAALLGETRLALFGPGEAAHWVLQSN